MKYGNLAKNTRTLALKHSALVAFSSLATNAALRCELRSAILERSENAERCESLLNALLENT
ncbi:hypothetical protein FR272_21240 [Vibrio vulnificus]|nr:hypothetical protein [Vibrio vulnificus]EGR0054706.1 hypothetical protein [Vibrio vulnificus]